MSHEFFALATIRPTTASNRPNSLSEFGLSDNLNGPLSDNISKPPLTLGLLQFGEVRNPKETYTDSVGLRRDTVEHGTRRRCLKKFTSSIIVTR